MRSDSGIFPGNQPTCVGAAVATKGRAQSIAVMGPVAPLALLPCVEFTTLGPFGGGVVRLGGWPKVRADLESGVERNRICSFMATLRGSLV
jgi:hypothetical protein